MFIFVLSLGWVLVSAWLVASFLLLFVCAVFCCMGSSGFSGKTSITRMLFLVVCGFGINGTRTFCGLSALLVGGFEQSVFVFWFVLFFGMLLGV